MPDDPRTEWRIDTLADRVDEVEHLAQRAGIHSLRVAELALTTSEKVETLEQSPQGQFDALVGTAVPCEPLPVEVALQRAINEKFPVALVYEKPVADAFEFGEPRPIYVELAPWRLTYPDNGGLVHGWDYFRQAPRQFRLDRIDRVLPAPGFLVYHGRD